GVGEDHSKEPSRMCHTGFHRAHATTVSRWTSRPAQRGYSTSITTSLSVPARNPRGRTLGIALTALRPRQHYGVLVGLRVHLATTRARIERRRKRSRRRVCAVRARSPHAPRPPTMCAPLIVSTRVPLSKEDESRSPIIRFGFNAPVRRDRLAAIGMMIRPWPTAGKRHRKTGRRSRVWLLSAFTGLILVVRRVRAGACPAP